MGTFTCHNNQSTYAMKEENSYFVEAYIMNNSSKFSSILNLASEEFMIYEYFFRKISILLS